MMGTLAEALVGCVPKVDWVLRYRGRKARAKAIRIAAAANVEARWSVLVRGS